MGTFWTAPTDNSTTVGWMPEPNNRGSLGVVWNCVQTVALCAWVSTCINIPSPKHGTTDMLRDKFYFVLLTLLGPEIVFMLAFSQYETARQSHRMFQDLGMSDWTLTHSWYADMGGIHVRPKNWKSFPVRGKQLYYLVKKGYMDYPVIPLREIKSKSKSDATAKVITVVQTLYFLVNFFARIQQGLFVTTLELTVVGLVFCTLLNSICWWHKPNDVDTSHYFDLPTPIDEILRAAGDDARITYRDTPLDFAYPEDWNASRLWAYYVNILAKLGLLDIIKEHDVEARPLQKFRSLNFPHPSGPRSAFIIWCTGLAYTASFFGAWYFHFPSRIEALLWRIVICIQMGITLVGGGFELYHFTTPDAPHKSLRKVLSQQSSQGKSKDRNEPASEKASEVRKKGLVAKLRRLWRMPCNNSRNRHPSMDVPLHSLVVITPLCAIYTICRWYILSEDIVGMRALPDSAYVEVSWSKYWPSF